MDELLFLNQISNKYQEFLSNKEILKSVIDSKKMILEKSKNNKVIFFGNGASASIASHCALDFTKQASIKSICFSDASFITAFSNDYGYENWISKALSFHANEGDIVVLISSSGSSPNIINGANYAKQNNLNLISFSGFEENNPLNQLGDIKFWIDSKAYNMIESMHQIWLLMICDLIIGKIEYSVS